MRSRIGEYPLGCVNGILHDPCFRDAYTDNLKREFQRIPFATDFRAFAAPGETLAKLHLDYKKLRPWELEDFGTPVTPHSGVRLLRRRRSL